jgi:predicted TIM-barrel fold metal-dependent hydrolase
MMKKRLIFLLSALQAPLWAQPVLLKDYHPESSLVVPVTHVQKARFPVIDFHAHSAFNGSTREAVDKWVRLMDEGGVETAIVYTDAIGAEFDRQAELFLSYGKRFQVYCSLDNTNIDAPDYGQRVVRELERCYRKGARGVGELSDKGWGLESGMTAYLSAKASGGKRAGPPRNQRVHIDDKRLDPFWEKCAELGLPVSLHVADHPSCWKPLGPAQERSPIFDTMNLYGQDVPSYEELLAMFDRVLARHPRTNFVAVHLINQGNDLASVAKKLDRNPNLYIDISAKTYELGREPRNAARFLARYKDRVLFGTDDRVTPTMYQSWWRFLETDDDYIPGSTGWRIYALALPDPVLEVIYRATALRILNWK